MTSSAMPLYNFRTVEPKWQREWDRQGAFKADDGKPNPYYVLEMLPYPSGRLHMGHVRNYALGDILARYKMAQGFNVLHPISWDSFGLPAENAAMLHKTHPAKWTNENIAAMKAQFKLLGLSFDWDREFSTCDVSYYRWEQKMFLDFLKNGLAYRKESWVNWDPVEHSVLANEQVVDGRGWRSGALVEKKLLSQWFLRISDYAEELLEALKGLEHWPDKVKTMQENWIGKREGAVVEFKVSDGHGALPVYTTTPEALYGATFCVISPEHPLAYKLAQSAPKLRDFIKEFQSLGTSQKVLDTIEKKGVDTGLTVFSPFEPDRPLPLWVANYVLMGYGTGAVFGCPAHDQTDYEFAQKYGFPSRVVLKKLDGSPVDISKEAYEGEGILIHSDVLGGLNRVDGKAAAIQRIEELKVGTGTTLYKLKDWGVSRQRYWGCPIPIIHCDTCGAVPVPEADLPVTLPEDVSFDEPGNPLDRHPTWKHTICPQCEKPATRETDTFDTFFESSWYFIRSCNPNPDKAFDKEISEKWMPVDQYIGGIEHAIMHLLYARFFVRALKKCGYIDLDEPFARLMTQGMVCHATFRDEDGKWVYPNDVVMRDGKLMTADEKQVIKGPSEKMSKSKNNLVDPSDIIATYGADTTRLFILSDSPPEKDFEWSDAGLNGCWRYINKLWKLAHTIGSAHIRNTARPQVLGAQASTVERHIHQTIHLVTETIETFQYNRTIAYIRELSNALETLDLNRPDEAWVAHFGLRILVQLMSPVVPHLADEIWHTLLGEKEILSKVPWPKADEALLVQETITLGVQVNGKLRGTLEISPDVSEETLKEKALALPNVKAAMDQKEMKKFIYVPNRIISIVVD